MGKQYVGLLALSQRKMCFRALSIFSSLVCFQYNYAIAGFLDTTRPFVTTATDILRGEKVSGSVSQNTPLWKLFDFENADAMNDKLEELSGEHAKVLENIAEQTENLEYYTSLLPEGFEGPGGIFKVKDGKLSTANVANTSKNKGSASQGAPTLFAALPTPSLPLMTSSIATSEESDATIQPCGPGTTCGNLQKAAKNVYDKLKSESDTSASPVKTSNANVSPASSGFVGGADFNRFAHDPNTVPASIRRPVTVASSAVPIDASKKEKDQLENVRFDTNPPIDKVGATTPIGQAGATTPIDQAGATVNENIFNVMPEGWFSHVQPDMGVEIRGALDTPFIPETDGKENHKNFIQIAVKDNRYGLDPGVYTIKKCSQCLNSYYSDYLKGLKKIAAGETNVNLSIPAVVEALSVLSIIKDGYKKKAEFVSESNTHLKTLNSIFNNSPELARAKPRYNIFEYLAPLREKSKGRLSDKSSEFIKLKNDITFLEALNKTKKIKL